eukprot:6851540-Prymnesium_polylepis.1
MGRETARIFSRGSAPHPAGASPQTPVRKAEIGQYNTEVVQLLAARPYGPYGAKHWGSLPTP